MATNTRIDELLERWKAAHARGEDLAPETLGAECPDMIEPLRQMIDALKSADQRPDTEKLGMTKSWSPGDTPHVNAVNAEDIQSSVEIEQTYGNPRFHAKGGLGAIYVAVDLQFHRDVVLKFMHEKHAQDEEARGRFLREAEITARLEHPGVVPVHGSGLAGDHRPFYVMRFIRGESLDSAINKFHERFTQGKTPDWQSLEFRALLARFLSVCNTIAYAHNRGIIHRDIKPDNVMLGKYGETLVVDWGLAMLIDRSETARASGEMTLTPLSGSQSGDSSGGGAGTPSYMSPEQAEGRLDLGPESDIYSLGGTLYKMLTGQPPVKGANVGEVIQKVKRGDLAAPGTVKKGLPKELEAICLKAMALESKQRYRGALELAKDVENWLGDEEVSAHREGWRQRFSRWGRHHRAWTQAGVFALVMVLVVASIAAVFLGRLANSERVAREKGRQLSAKFAAKSLANEIDLRWRILELEAADTELRSLLERINKAPNDQALRDGLEAWLNKRYILHDETSKASGWFIDDAAGTLQALTRMHSDDRFRSPIGKNFAYRDYFHGLGRDLKEGESAQIKPIDSVHRSIPFVSKSDGKLKVAFSVPVKSIGGDRQFQGILGMVVEIGRFEGLQTKSGRSAFAVLVDTKSDWLENEERKGLILHHPRLVELHQEGETLSEHIYRLDPELLKRLEKLRELRMRKDPQDGPATRSTSSDADDYHDPVEGRYQGSWLASFEPVLVNGRPARIKDTGWVVIVQERK